MELTQPLKMFPRFLCYRTSQKKFILNSAFFTFIDKKICMKFVFIRKLCMKQVRNKYAVEDRTMRIEDRKDNDEDVLISMFRLCSLF